MQRLRKETSLSSFLQSEEVESDTSHLIPAEFFDSQYRDPQFALARGPI